MLVSPCYWEQNLSPSFFNFLNDGKGFSDNDKYILELIYISSGLKDELFISLIESLKGRPEFLDEYFRISLLTYGDCSNYFSYKYEIHYKLSDFESIGKYKYNFYFTAQYALKFFGDEENGVIIKKSMF